MEQVALSLPTVSQPGTLQKCPLPPGQPSQGLQCLRSGVGALGAWAPTSCSFSLAPSLWGPQALSEHSWIMEMPWRAREQPGVHGTDQGQGPRLQSLNGFQGMHTHRTGFWYLPWMFCLVT